MSDSLLFISRHGVFLKLCHVPVGNAQDKRQCACSSSVDPLSMPAKTAETFVHISILIRKYYVYGFASVVQFNDIYIHMYTYVCLSGGVITALPHLAFSFVALRTRPLPLDDSWCRGINPSLRGARLEFGPRRLGQHSRTASTLVTHTHVTVCVSSHAHASDDGNQALRRKKETTCWDLNPRSTPLCTIFICVHCDGNALTYSDMCARYM